MNIIMNEEDEYYNYLNNQEERLLSSDEMQID